MFNMILFLTFSASVFFLEFLKKVNMMNQKLETVSLKIKV